MNTAFGLKPNGLRMNISYELTDWSMELYDLCYILLQIAYIIRNIISQNKNFQLDQNTPQSHGLISEHI